MAQPRKRREGEGREGNLEKKAVSRKRQRGARTQGGQEWGGGLGSGSSPSKVMKGEDGLTPNDELKQKKKTGTSSQGAAAKQGCLVVGREGGCEREVKVCLSGKGRGRGDLLCQRGCTLLGGEGRRGLTSVGAFSRPPRGSAARSQACSSLRQRPGATGCEGGRVEGRGLSCGFQRESLVRVKSRERRLLTTS